MADTPDPVSPRPRTLADHARTRRPEGPRPCARTRGPGRHAGVTDAMVAEIDRALEAHELIKVKIGEGDRDARVAHAEAIAARTGAAVVQRVGRVLILWRPRPDAEPRVSAMPNGR